MSSMRERALLERCAPEVSPVTMAALVAQESGGDPYALDDDSTHIVYHSVSYAAATRLAAQLIGAGHSVDLGLAQVNSGWLPALHLTAAELLDPCENLRAGGLILLRAWRAAGAGLPAGGTPVRSAGPVPGVNDGAKTIEIRRFENRWHRSCVVRGENHTAHARIHHVARKPLRQLERAPRRTRWSNGSLGRTREEHRFSDRPDFTTFRLAMTPGASPRAKRLARALAIYHSGHPSSLAGRQYAAETYRHAGVHVIVPAIPGGHLARWARGGSPAARDALRRPAAVHVLASGASSPQTSALRPRGHGLTPASLVPIH